MEIIAYGLFLFRYEDQGLPEWWKDSEVIWSLTSEHDIDNDRTGESAR